MQTPQIPHVFRNPSNDILDVALHPGHPDNRTLVLLGHGVTGNKDRPLVVVLANALAAAGIHALRFSFAGNGNSGGRFEDCTLGTEVADLGALLDALPDWHIGYVGHSMGAAVGTLRAATDPRIRFLVSLGGMAHTADFARREFGTLTPGTGCMWDKPECPLSKAYMDDMARVGSVLDAARQVRIPWLWVHGLEDDVVPPQDSRDLAAVAGDPGKLIELPGADQVFSDAHATTMAGVVTDWITSLPAARA